GNNLAYRLESEIVRAAAIPLGLEVLAAEIRSGDDIAPTFAAIATNADALLVVGEPLTFTYRSQLSALAHARRCQQPAPLAFVSRCVARCPLHQLSRSCSGP